MPLLLWLAAGAAVAAADADASWTNPWRNADGTLTDKSVLVTGNEDDGRGGVFHSLPVAGWDGEGGGEGLSAMLPVRSSLGVSAADFPLEKSVVGSGKPAPARATPRTEYNRLAGGDPGAMNDRGIDSADVKWRRQARLQGERMRMLNGPEFAMSSAMSMSDTERGLRLLVGAVMPLNPRWELAALNSLGLFTLKETGERAGRDILTLRLGPGPNATFRPWIALTPYMNFGAASGGGAGLSGGLGKYWANGISIAVEGYAWRPWDEGFSTTLQDGRSHGVSMTATMPINRRLTLLAGAEYEFLELGPGAPDGARYAGRRGGWDARANFLLLKRDGAFMGYGFRDETLWTEQLVPMELGIFGDLRWQRYVRPDGFDILAPTPKMFQQRVGVYYNQAFSPSFGLNTEAYVGQDTGRGLSFGGIFGATARLTVVLNPRFRLWCGWGYEKTNNTLEGAGGPEHSLSFGMNCNF